MTAKPHQHTERVLNEIAKERMRQIKIKGYTPESDDESVNSHLFGLMEERMILAEAYMEDANFVNVEFVRDKLIEVAALSAALIEQLDRKKSAA